MPALAQDLFLPISDIKNELGVVPASAENQLLQITDADKLAGPKITRDTLPSRPNISSAVGCIPDYMCAAGHSANCCSKKSYFTAEALQCEIGGKGPCEMCQKAVTYVAGKLESGATCAALDLDAAAVCAVFNLEDGDLLMPACEFIVVTACSKLVPMIAKKVATPALVTGICNDAIKFCPATSGTKGAHFCGCLEKGQCVDPFTAGSVCCSGKSQMLYPLEHCDKSHHNTPAPAKCK